MKPLWGMRAAAEAQGVRLPNEYAGVTLPTDPIHQPVLIAGWAYQEAEDHAYRLEQLLLRHGIRINPGSDLEGAVLKVAHLAERARTDHLARADENFRDTYRTMAGLHDLAGQLLAVADHYDFNQLVPHLRLLNAGSALQNTSSPAIDQATNKLYELFVATQAMRCGTQLLLDDPERSTGTNPDVLITIGGRRWGIACKVFHGRTSEGFAQLLLDGADQIDRSEADVGFVAFNLKNILRHDDYWPLAGIPEAPDLPVPWPSPDLPFQMVRADIEGHGRALISHLPPGFLQQHFAARRSLPGAFLWGTTVSGAMFHGQPTAMNVRHGVFVSWGDVAPNDCRVVERLHQAAFPDAFRNDGLGAV